MSMWTIEMGVGLLWQIDVPVYSVEVRGLEENGQHVHVLG